MPEIRQNIATREWVIIATERARRPEQFILPPHERTADGLTYADDCPFCPGNEELDLERLRIPAEGDWQLRVVRNRYPALQETGELTHTIHGIHHQISGIGYHEIVIESRLHNTCPALESAAEIEQTFLAYQERGHALISDLRVEQIIYFKNHGVTAGASLLHPHAQILALPMVPLSIESRVETAQQFFHEHGKCVICYMRESEESEQIRIVAESPYFSAFVPYAAFSPFHLWVIPRRHSASFLDASAEEIADLARLLRDLLRRIYFGMNDPDYNYLIRSSPIRRRGASYLHWYVAIVPRISRSAGFELGSGMFINPSLPEESAVFLRNVQVPPTVDA